MSLGSLGGVELLVDGEMIHFYRRQTAIVGLMEVKTARGTSPPALPASLLRQVVQPSFLRPLSLCPLTAHSSLDVNANSQSPHL